jgi:hypothetical protein
MVGIEHLGGESDNGESSKCRHSVRGTFVTVEAAWGIERSRREAHLPILKKFSPVSI